MDGNWPGAIVLGGNCPGSYWLGAIVQGAIDWGAIVLNKDLYNTIRSYYNLCGIGSQHSNISKGKKGGWGTYKSHWYARLQYSR
jgi:hypothetical protein